MNPLYVIAGFLFFIMHHNEILFFLGFLSLIFIILFIDLGIFDKHSHKVGFRESLIWTLVWISLALGFFIFLRFEGNLLHGINSIELLKAKITENAHPINIEGLDLQQAIQKYNFGEFWEQLFLGLFLYS
mgnify:CR=1 FL=1